MASSYQAETARFPGRMGDWLGTNSAQFLVAIFILVLGFLLLYPALLILVNAFNVAPNMFLSPREWGLGNWRAALDNPLILRALGNTFLIWGLTTVISFPVAVLIAWALARTRIPFTHGLEFMFWVSYMLPTISTTIAWIMVFDPWFGIGNTLIEALPFVDQGPFNIFSIPGIVWAGLMANGVSIKVMLLTPAFRNMDLAMEEAARVSGASNLKTMVRVTLPLMVSPMILVLALQMVRVFQSFEIEQLLGVPFGFYNYATLIFSLARQEPPLYGQATVLASLTLLIVALIIPMQRWVLARRKYTTISGKMRPGVIDLGKWKYVVFGIIALLIVLLTVFPTAVLVLGSFMRRAGFFDISPAFTLAHWQFILGDGMFLRALRTTLIISVVAALGSPLLFSIIAYIIIRTRLRGRVALDTIIWVSAAIPGMLTGLGLLQLFLGTPGLSILYGSIYALLIVVVLSGNTTGVNITKGVLVQLGQDVEEAARVSGAGWTRTYFTVVLRLLAPTMVLLAVLNFTSAATTTSSIILLASRDTVTLSILSLELMRSDVAKREAASVVALIMILMTVGLSVALRAFGLRLGVRNR